MQQQRPSEEVADLKITLMHSDPQIWRSVRVPTMIGLHHLHEIIQCLYQWNESHLHSFYVEGIEYQNPDNSFGTDDRGNKPKNEKLLKLASIIENEIGEFRYIYDFGDHWEFSIQIVNVQMLVKLEENLILLIGENASPPEDIGGIPG